MMLLFNSHRFLSPLFPWSCCITFSISNEEITDPKLLLQSTREMHSTWFFPQGCYSTSKSHKMQHCCPKPSGVLWDCFVDSVTSFTKDKYITLKHWMHRIRLSFFSFGVILYLEANPCVIRLILKNSKK